MIRGAFAELDQYNGLSEMLPKADFQFENLPILPDIYSYIDLYSQKVSAISRPCIVCGISLGGLIALGVSAPNHVATLALDPPMTVGLNSPIRSRFTPRLGHDAATDAFLSNIFGISKSQPVERDHFAVLDRLRVRSYVLAGSHSADLNVMPTLLGEDEFVRLQSHPLIVAKRIRGVGHNVALGATSIIVRALDRLVTLTGGPP